MKAKNSDVYIYTRETSKDAAEYYAADASLAGGSKLTDIGAQQSQFAPFAGGWRSD